VLSNLTGSCCVLLNLAFGIYPLKEEQTGFLLSAVGAILVMCDPMAKRADNYETSGNVLFNLVFSSVFGAAYLLFNNHNTREFRIFFLMFFQSLQMFVLSSLTAFAFNSGRVAISCDPTWGLFGFLNSEQLINLIVLQGLVVGLCADFGKNFSYFFHAPVVIHSCLLVVPFVAEGFGNAFYIDQSLDFLSFLGAMLAAVGVFKIHKGDRRRRAIIIKEQL
jgi:uncharacterized membrane protein